MTPKDSRDDIPLLVVDLDGTLIRSDTLFECFWAALSQSWGAIPVALGALGRGRAALKHALAALGPPDAAYLPYNEVVLDHIRDWRARGGRAVLVTAADQAVADSIAAYLGLFDAAHGSDGESNLKGAQKARMIADIYGAEPYAYIGDSRADLPVWAGAQRAITVDAPAALRDRLEKTGAQVTHLQSAGGRGAWLAALRPHQWLKNLLVFVPVIAAHAVEGAVMAQALLAFVAFCLVSSAGYVFNDLMDLRADRAHPRKAQRAIASGRVPIARATVMVPMLLGGGLGLAALGGGPLLAMIAGYFGLTVTYSLTLKRVAIADICTLAGLYTMRILAGGLATGLLPSVWLLAFSMFFFVALAAIKRQAELVDLFGRGLPVAERRGYTVEDLPLVRQVAVASGYVSVLVLALYLDAPAVQRLYGAPWLLWGICLVLLYWITRVALITSRGGMHDDPIVFALRDPVSLVCLGLMGGLAAGAALL